MQIMVIILIENLPNTFKMFHDSVILYYGATNLILRKVDTKTPQKLGRSFVRNLKRQVFTNCNTYRIQLDVYSYANG